MPKLTGSFTSFREYHRTSTRKGAYGPVRGNWFLACWNWRRNPGFPEIVIRIIGLDLYLRWW